VIPVLPVKRIKKRLLGSGYPAHWVDALAKAIGRKKKITGETLADIIEVVAKQLDEWTLEQWGEIVLRLAPEMFGTPRQSCWPSDAPAGSYEKIRRLRRRAARGLDLWQHQDESDHASKNAQPQAKPVPITRQPASDRESARSRVRQRVDSVQQAVPQAASALPKLRAGRKNNSGQPGRSHHPAAPASRLAARSGKPPTAVPKLPRSQNGSRDKKHLKK
jgi:hypothetical protein